MTSILPRTYDGDKVARLLASVSGGVSFAASCRAVGIPVATFWSWVSDDVEGLGERSKRARESGCDALADQCVEIADVPEHHVEVAQPDGSVERRPVDDVQHRRLRIETRIRLLGKWSKRYSDKQDVNHTADAGLAEAIVAARQRAGG